VAVRQLHHVGVVVDDLAAAIEFFVRIGLEAQDRFTGEGEPVDRIVGLEGVRADCAFVTTPDGLSRLELIEFRSPPYEGDAGRAPSNAPGLRHLAFEVDDLDNAIAGLELVGEVRQFGDTYRLCYVRGPAGIIVELAERVTAG